MATRTIGIIGICLLCLLALAATPEETLRQNTGSEGIRAGSTHFADLWARDALYASWGALAIDHTNAAYNTLLTLRKNQAEDGQIPLRVGRKNMFLVFLGFPGEKGAVYGNDKTDDPAIDSNCLYVITAAKYYDHTRDEVFKENFAQSIEDALAWLTKRQGRDSLVHEGKYASWDDSLHKRGATLYSNICVWKALHDAAIMLDDDDYMSRANGVRGGIYKELWREDRFASSTGRDVMDVPANLLAVHYGFTSQEEAEDILESLDKRKEAAQEILPRVNYELYPWEDVYMPFYLVGIADYHNNGPYWSWVAALEALVRAEQGQTDEAQLILKQLNIFHDASGGVHEVYETSGNPVNRLWYDSEEDFSWAAGMQILAEQQLAQPSSS